MPGSLCVLMAARLFSHATNSFKEMTATADILPPKQADMQKPCAGQPYRPSNGLEGDLFRESMCERCGSLTNEHGNPCQVMVMTMHYCRDDPDYPREWQYSATGQPTCTAFHEAGAPVPKARCEYTVDLFGA
ncbi:hypothetical protein AB3X91_03590 [Paraburkholderia sp. BR14263]|uniref:hypothetical protein n=1 Tax=unclassified Paraburkholderia TaxID=2615204 RepID=UPI0034CE1F25